MKIVIMPGTPTRSEDGTVQQNTAADLDAAVAAAAAALHQEPAPHPAAAVPAGGGPMAYGLLPKPKRNAVLLAVSLAALLVPMTDLPALQAVGQELQAEPGPVAATVALYMLAAGIGCLCWISFADRFGRRMAYAIGSLLFLGSSVGCICAHSIGLLLGFRALQGLAAASFLATGQADRFGRRMAYAIGSLLFLGSSVGCICAHSIGLLLGFRALQGLAAASFLATGQSVVVNVFGPAERDRAAHLFTMPLLVGPMLGPLLGGLLCQDWGWRSSLIFMAAAAGVVVLPLLKLVVPETHQFLTVQRLRKANPEAASHLTDAEAIMSRPPTFRAPCVHLKHLAGSSSWLFMLLAMTAFGFMFASLTGALLCLMLTLKSICVAS
uniref:Major facilitator superfamily (MFS) profile domain-containing protein n=2 Tax=Tetradesmus obliquus TaxID=3088 RepID=A0A383WNC2_TETOB|eukprot:jgi/Sobl393_1/13688/SZX78684.1